MVELQKLFPRYVINSHGERKEFDGDKIAEILSRETGLEFSICEQISNNVLRVLINVTKKEITTNFIRELVCVELSKQNLQSYRDLFMKGFSYSRYSFQLNDEFLEKFKEKQPQWGELGYFTYKRTYARYIEGEDRKEEFWETLKRVVEGCFTYQKQHCKTLGLPWSEDEAQTKAQIMYEKIWTFKMCPPGRGLWIMGTEFITRHGSMALNNCAFVSTEDIDIKGSKAFRFLMDALMVGVGVGFDVKGAGKLTIKKPLFSDEKFKIPDSREGWIESLGIVLDGYFTGNIIPFFDYSLIRPAGKPIRGFGGIASGHEPLKELLEDVSQILQKRINDKITSLDILDIMNNIAKCVIAGNVRRSAEISLGEHNDTDFILAKQDGECLNSHRWASNNSIIAEIGMNYSFIADQINKNGEPGIFWLENACNYSRMNGKIDCKDKQVKGCNPCGEISLESYELCNLVETFPSNHDSYEEFEETLKYAYIYAKTISLINTTWKETNAVVLKNRRIGISQTGIIQAIVKHGRRTMLEWCDKGYIFLKKLDKMYSLEWLCVPQSIKLTTIKPSGSISLLAGVTPGIHYPHSEYYIRRIRVASNSDLLPQLRKAGYTIVNDNNSKNTVVIEFPIHEINFERSKFDVSMWEQLQNVADFQKYWADNQVSITVTIKEEEKKDIQKALECFEDKLKSVSFLPLKNHGYTQAPYETITKKQYEDMISKLTPLDLTTTKDKSLGEKYCDADGTCQL